MDIGYIKKEIGEIWIKETNELSSMLSGLMKRKQTFLKKL
jgi:hypothetical protein